ncbi:hypothetical protein BD413DRAFT_665554 [Trametes elegans]|nr:hypothetical protein BD413DRAFT_665554 [Trametes elegans]
MASRAFSRRFLAQSLRAPAAARAAARPAGRRLASTSVEHAAKTNSDTPWIALYLLVSPGKDKGKHAADAHHAKAAKANAPSEQLLQDPAPKEEEAAPAPEGGESSTEVENSTAQAVGSSASSSDGKLHGTPAMTDADGNTASAEEIDASLKLAFKANLPEDAQRAEAQDAKYSEGAPGQTSEAETDHEQKEKPGRPHTGTFQGDEDGGPTDLGDARESAKVSAVPA